MKICLDIKDGMAKVAEIAILQKLHDAFKANPNNYLVNFFSKNLLTWAEGQLKNDFPCDVMENWEWTEAQLRLAEEAVRKIASVAKVEKDLSMTAIDSLERTVLAKTETIADMEIEIANLNRLLQAFTAENGEITEMNVAVAARVGILEMEIVALKARLYDAGIAK